MDLSQESIDRLSSSLATACSIKLSPFSGPQNDINKWIEDYEDLASVNNWSNRTKCKKLPVFLTGSARDYHREEIRGRDVENNWPQLKAKIKEFFQPVNYETQCREALGSRNQRSAEPVQTYILDMKRLAKQADANMAYKELKYWVLRGMDTRIKTCLTRREIPDMETLVTEARKIEASLACDPSSGTSAETKALVDNVQKLTDVVLALVQKQTAPQQEQVLMSHREPIVQCHYCGRHGHVKRACRLRQHHREEGRHDDHRHRSGRQSHRHRKERHDSDSETNSSNSDSSSDSESESGCKSPEHPHHRESRRKHERKQMHVKDQNWASPSGRRNHHSPDYRESRHEREQERNDGRRHARSPSPYRTEWNMGL